MAQAPQPPQDTLNGGADSGALLGPGSSRADANYSAARADLQAENFDSAAAKDWDATEAWFEQRHGKSADQVARILSSLPPSERAAVDQAYLNGEDVKPVLERLYEKAIGGPLPATLGAVDAELATIDKAMRADRKAYFANDKLRQRAVELYRLQERLRAL